MERHVDSLFTEFSSRKLEQLALRIATCLDALNEEQIWSRNAGNPNAIGNLILHLCGNVRQWIVAGVGQQPDQRDRPAEFAARGGASREELLRSLTGTIEIAAPIIGGLTAAQLVEVRKIQNYQVTVLEAVYHVVEHFSQHTGQIIFLTRLLTGQEMGFYRHLDNPAHGQSTP